MGGIRVLAVVPAALCTAALVLSFLCLFAGSKRNFMEDYAIMTLNTSQIGQDVPLFDEISDSLSRRDLLTDNEVAKPLITAAPQATGSPELAARGDIKSVFSEATDGVGSLYTKATAAIPIPTQAVAAVGWLKSEGHNLTEELVEEAENITKKFEDLIKDGLGDLAQVLGIHDFYSAHIMDFCEGYYVPGSVPNDTVEAGSIHKNVTGCSNKTAMFHFDPAKYISQELNESTNGFIDLSTVDWPEDIQHALNALKMAQKAVFVLYCLAISFIFLAMVGSLMGIFFNGRMSALINVITDLLACATITVASALITYVGQKATHFINKHGDEIGVSATRGNKFLALTWATTSLVFIAMLIWTYLMFTSGRSRRSRRQEMQQKQG